jgi:trk system potassium uptake protein TrkA
MCYNILNVKKKRSFFIHTAEIFDKGSDFDMKIIIIGCGKVGLTLAEKLAEEGHDLVLVDSSLPRLQSIPDELDAIRLHGNGSSINTLMEADIKHADILIAVTSADELNLLCCLIAKKASQCHTIARVRTPDYSREANFFKEKLGISMIINPEYAAAMEIARLLSFPSAIKIDSFPKSRVELLKFRLRPDFSLHDISVSQFAQRVHSDILICGVERDGQITIPDGNFVLRANDMISIIASPLSASRFFYDIGLNTHPVRNALIVGGGKVAYYLITHLLASKIDVRIIEQNPATCEDLCTLFPNATILCGNGTDRQLLLEEGLVDAEAFVTLTGLDEENIFLALFAKSHSNAKLVTKVNRIDFDDIIANLDIGSVVYPKNLAADYILQYVRAMSNSIDSNVETLYRILDSKVEALEFAIHEQSAVTDTPLSELTLKSGLLIGCINRHGKIIIPRGQDHIQVGDTVIVVTTHKGLRDISDILGKPKRML